MLPLAQYKNILSLNNQGNSIRNIGKLTRHSRNTIRKVLKIKAPLPFKASCRTSKIDDHKNIVKEKFDIGTFTAQQIYDEIIKNGYDGSYSTVSRYLSKLVKQRELAAKKLSRTKGKKNEKHVAWVLSLLQGKISLYEIEELFVGHLDTESISKLYRHMIESSLRYRNRSVTIFAYSKKIPKMTIAEVLGIRRKTVRSYIEQFESGGTAKLFDFTRKATKKCEEPGYKDKVFQILHSPPSFFEFNRTTWRMEDLFQIIVAEGFPLSKVNIRKIIKNAGYRFIKARKVLTSNDPLYREKLQEIVSILSNLKPTEKFFSIDEFGPLAIKIRGGRSWTSPDDHKIIPQWQKSKGSLIVTPIHHQKK